MKFGKTQLSKLCDRATIEDLHNKNCSEQEQEKLLDFFEFAVTNTRKARDARYDLNDFDVAKQNGLQNFTLAINRQT